jgi:hypothetical protein
MPEILPGIMSGAKSLRGARWMTGREAQIWEQADALIQAKQPNNYVRAIHHLIDLRDLAARREQESGVASRLERFLRRLADAGL